MHIVQLAHAPELIPTLASWSLEQWAYLHPERTLAESRQIIARRCNTTHLPLGLIALEKKRPVGMVFLKEKDLASSPHLGPWLAGLYVDKAWRGRGIGKKLVKAAEQQAWALGIKELYLFTPDATVFYAKHGWFPYQYSELSGRKVTVMMRCQQTYAT